MHTACRKFHRGTPPNFSARDFWPKGQKLRMFFQLIKVQLAEWCLLPDQRGIDAGPGHVANQDKAYQFSIADH